MGNNFTGEIPIQISNLVNLNGFWLDGNYFSGQIPDSMGDLPNINSINMSYNLFSGEIPESICDLGLDWGQWDNGIWNGISNNNLCPPYPECIGEGNIGYQDTSECIDCPDNIEGDIDADGEVTILDIVSIVNCILSNDCDECSDWNFDGSVDILDIILMINIIL